MKTILVAMMILGSVTAHAARSTCDGAISIDTLPVCDAANLGLACALSDPESYQVYLCQVDGWAPTPGHGYAGQRK